MICAIHQIQFMPGLRFFSKMSSCDIFVYLDDVQFEKREFQNRNKIKTASGIDYLTLPVLTKGRFSQTIKETEINPYYDWRKEHLAKIRTNYSKAAFFNKYYPSLEKIYFKNFNKMTDISFDLINFFRDILEIKTPFRLSSEFSLNLKSSKRLAEICFKVGAKAYLSGIGGKNYLDTEPFKERGIEVLWQNFIVKPYPQLFGEFKPDLSVLDLIFNCGESSRRYL